MTTAAARARVVHFSLCTRLDCPFGTESHLIAGKGWVDVERGIAVAVSYAWGMFDRKSRTIGHYDDENIQTPLIMELGAEWMAKNRNTDASGGPYHDRGIIGTLHWICAEVNPNCWIDQVSIVQDDDEEMRATLARIPDIYRAFDVVAILPGALCQCWQNRYYAMAGGNRQYTGLDNSDLIEFRHSGFVGNNTWIGRTPEERRILSKAPQAVPVHEVATQACWNSLGFSVWFQRLWTRQEFTICPEH